jgi:hypothetical protein
MFGQRLGSRPESMREVGRLDKWQKRKRGLLLGLVFFRLVAPPLQPGVVGLYLVWGLWFPRHLALDGTGRIQNFGP